MMADTGTISFLLYGVFIILTILAMIVAIYLIKKGSIEPEKLDKMINLFKYAIVSTAIATVTLVIADLFKEREQDVKELEYFDKYIQDVKKVDGVLERLQLSKYLSIVAPSGALQQSWSRYYDSVKIEYKEYLKVKNEKQNLESISNPTKEQLFRLEQLQAQINQKDAPLVSYRKASEGTRDLKTARNEEEIGFDYLLKKDLLNSLNAFTQSENAFNQYHQVFEISNYLRENKAKLLDPNSAYWKTALFKIANDYSYGMPVDIKTKLINSSK